MRMTRVVLLAAVAAGCGSQAPSAPPPAPAGRTLTGKAVRTMITDSGSTDVPINLQANLLALQFPQPDGSWTDYGVIADPLGNFTAQDLPDGPYWFENYNEFSTTVTPPLARQFVWTDADAITIQAYGIGRTDLKIASLPTTLDLDLSGLVPTTQGVELDLASANLGLATFVAPALQPGATTVSQSQKWGGLPLGSAAAHDRLMLAESTITRDAATGVDIFGPVAAVTLSDLEMTDGQANPVTAALAPVAATPVDVSWKRSAFNALAPSIHPTRAGQAVRSQLGVLAVPGGASHGLGAGSNFVMFPLDGLGDPTADLQITLPMRNPYPASWLYTFFESDVLVHVPTPDHPELGEQVFVASLFTATGELPSADKPVVPIISPARNPTIAGQDLFEDQNGVGLTPRIAWQPPAIGTPTAYFLDIYRWDFTYDSSSQQQLASLTLWAELVVPGDVTSVRVPDRVLDPGGQYLIGITAQHAEGQDLRTGSPSYDSVPLGVAALVGNTFTP